MARRDKHSYRPVTYGELVKHAHVNEGAKRAMAEYSALYEKMREKGREPRILYSEFNGYCIKDPFERPYSN